MFQRLLLYNSIFQLIQSKFNAFVSRVIILIHLRGLYKGFLQYSDIQFHCYSAVLYNFAVQCSAIRYSAVLWYSAVIYSAVR
jgi:hypothetical protein